MTRPLEDESGQIDSNRESLEEEQRTNELNLKGLAEREEVLKLMEDAVNQKSNKLEARIVLVFRETVVDTTETVDTDVYKSFIRGAYKKAVRKITTTMLEDDVVRKAFESAIIRVVTSTPIVHAAANMVIKEEKPMEPGAKFVAGLQKGKIPRQHRRRY